jgi:predicted DNA-binding transcriptional regulator YafY
MRQDLRTFKFERILSVRPQGTKFPPPEDFDINRYKQDFLQSMGTQPIEIYFGPQLAPWIQEQWGSAVRGDRKGGVILTLHSETLEFPSRLVLGSAPHARPLSPPEFVEKVRRDAREIVSLYESTALAQ